MYKFEDVEELYPGAGNFVFEAMKYNPGNESKIKNAAESGDWFAQEKKDGALYFVTLTADGDYAFSRSPSKTTGLPAEKGQNIPHILNHFSELPKGTVILGEVYYPGGTSKDTTSIMGCLADKAVQRQKGSYGPIHFYMFDILAFDNINFVKAKLTNRQRYEVLKALVKKYNLTNDCIELASIVTENILGECARIIADGGEGMVIKMNNGVYEEGKRPQTNYKVKQVDTVDVICMGTVDPTKEYNGKELASWEYWEDSEGNKMQGLYADKGYSPITKAYFHEWKTAIRIGLYEENGNLKEIGTVASGLTDEDRAALAKTPEDYIGSVVEIQCMSRDKKEKTLRHPFILRFRDDKEARDCLIKEVF